MRIIFCLVLAAAMGSPAFAIEAGTYTPSILEWALSKTHHEIEHLWTPKDGLDVFLDTLIFNGEEHLIIIIKHMEGEPKRGLDVYTQQIKDLIQSELNKAITNLFERGEEKSLSNELLTWVTKYNEAPKDQKVSVGFPYEFEIKYMVFPQDGGTPFYRK